MVKQRSLEQGLGNNPNAQGNLAKTPVLIGRGNGSDWAAPGEGLEELQKKG